MAAFHVGKVPPAIPLLRTDLGVDGATIGWVLAIFSLIAAGGGIAFGRIADRVGRRRMAILGLSTLALASAAGAAATSIPFLLVTRVVEGLGFITTAIAIPALLAAIAANPADRRLALALCSAYIPLGSALVLLAAPLVFAFGGWRVLWLVSAAAAGVAAVAIGLRVRDGGVPAPSDEPLGAGARAVLAARAPAIAGIAFGTYAGSYFILVGFLPAILVASGRSVAAAALLTTLVVTANGLGNIAGALVSGRFPRRAVLVAGASILGLGGALEYVTSVPAELRVGAGAVGAFAGGLVPGTLMAAVPQLSPAPRLIATTQGLVLQLSNVGQLLGPVIVASLGAARGGLAGSAVLLAMAATGIVAALSLRNER